MTATEILSKTSHYIQSGTAAETEQIKRNKTENGEMTSTDAKIITHGSPNLLEKDRF